MERSYALPPNRSISLPSRLHSTSLRLEAELNKLRGWEIRSWSSSETLTAEAIQTGLVCLSEVYRCVEELVYSSLAQHGSLLEDALDHSVNLLDSCRIVRDMQQKMKEQVLCLQSRLLRRGAELQVRDEISSYIRLRKKLKKEASKYIKSLKRAEKKFTHVPSLKDYQLAMLVKVLREVNLITSRVLQCLLLFLSSSGTMVKNKYSGCSLISKLRSAEKSKKITNEVGNVEDTLLCVLHGTEEITLADRKLENLVISLDCIDAGLDVVFRRLIQYRVSILNVLTR
ncbi:hypothetical protein CTI12_AA613530 [Artemisia annua]|uniref:Uncharacterized protein n=1 Tax=Artemisia annua TaxID=35608 RepID=A0A2U1KE73_ARTAN|nr:hypothetical protein CTI12_AA613530 [Artemisia annua]